MVQTFVKRTTSPLHFEPLRPSPADVLWPGSDDEADEDEWEKKRLRIEILAKQYLDGRPLFIQTAGLRGPFCEGWVNPWADKKTKRKADEERFLEPPEPAGKAFASQIENDLLFAIPKKKSTPDAGVGSSKVKISKISKEPGWEEPLAKRRRHEVARPSGLRSSDRTPEDNNMILQSDPLYEWLKTDNGYRNPSSRDSRVLPSPTPTSRLQGMPPKAPSAKSLSREPIEISENEERERKKIQPFEAAPSPIMQDPKPSRLSPYVSDFTSKSDNATSAGLKAAIKVPKPSPHVVPPSTHLPEFQYHYTTKAPSSTTHKHKDISIENSQKPKYKSRSVSSSSSGSSDFAEAFEAAQAKAIPGSVPSSYSSSPIVQRPETKSIRKNTQALKRLTFSPSGEPRIAASLRPSSSSSAANPLSVLSRCEGATSEGGKEKTRVRNGESKPSTKSLTNHNPSRDSVILPDAQIVSDNPIRLVQLPSGPSTDLIETDKQSPNFVDLTEEDSYLELSTQAAMLKAHRAFKDEVLSPFLKKEATRPRIARTTESDTTPIAKDSTKVITNHANVRQDFKDDVEPMSTQAIADGISPFAVTTVKKQVPHTRKIVEMTPSGRKDRHQPLAPIMSPNLSPTTSSHRPLSMATSPTDSQLEPTPPIPLSHVNNNSKPPSSLTSLSMLPNGTVSESSMLQDGQQPRANFNTSLPIDPFHTPFATARGDGDCTSGSSELKAAIEEAGSFLGDWDIEAEARKAGSSSKKKEAGPRSIISFGKKFS